MSYKSGIEKIIKSGLKICHHNYTHKYGEYADEYSIYNEKKEASLVIRCEGEVFVTYKGYTVPLDKSDAEDIELLVQLTYASQEDKNKRKALKELKGESSDE